MTMVDPAIDFGDPAFWRRSRKERDSAFRTLRGSESLRYTVDRSFFAGEAPEPIGYWSLVDYDDVWMASRNPLVFASGSGTNITDDPPEVAELFGSIVNMDDPRHFRMRSIVSRAFTPRHLERVKATVRSRAAALVDQAANELADGSIDFVEAIAAPLPLGVICEMMGIPAADEAFILRWTNTILGAGDPEFGAGIDDFMACALAMFDYAQALASDLALRQGEDLTSVIMATEVDGERLSAAEFGAFFILLVVAGNETTRNALSHGLLALTDHPEQRRIWFDEFDTVSKTAVEEIVRWATPVIHFRRTVTEDIIVRDTHLHPGDKVVLWYCSANRDEAVWKDAHRFDVRRPAQPMHLGFGGGGPHFCLGANLARHEIACVFDEIRRRIPNLSVAHSPDWLESNFINGIKRLPCHLD